MTADARSAHRVEGGRVSGDMLWFNNEKGHGFIETAGGDRLRVEGHLDAVERLPTSIDGCVAQLAGKHRVSRYRDDIGAMQPELLVRIGEITQQHFLSGAHESDRALVSVSAGRSTARTGPARSGAWA